MGIQEKYLAESEARDVVTRSGYTWRVSGACALDFGELLGGLPMLTYFGDAKQLSPEDAEKRRGEISERQKALHKACFERYVEGLVDPESGQVSKPPYERVLYGDVQDLAEEVMSRGGMTGARADQARRSLREPGLLPGAGRDGEPVREAPVKVDGV